MSVDLDEDFLLLGLGSLGGGLLFAREEVDNALSDKGGALKGSLGDLSDLLLAELESGGGLLGEVLLVRFLDLLWLLWGLLGIVTEAGGSGGWLVRSAPSSITLSSWGLRSGLLVGGVLLALDLGAQLGGTLVGTPSGLDLLLAVLVTTASSLELSPLTAEGGGLSASDGTGSSGRVAAGGVATSVVGVLGVPVWSVVGLLGGSDSLSVETGWVLEALSDAAGGLLGSVPWASVLPRGSSRWPRSSVTASSASSTSARSWDVSLDGLSGLLGSGAGGSGGGGFDGGWRVSVLTKSVERVP